MLKLFDRCPACGGAITITECKCANCQLEMRGQFEVRQFSRLADDELAFVRVFLRARGNLSEAERVLGVSYPTIRSKLDEVIKSLDNAEASPQASHSASIPAASTHPGTEDARRAILHQVAAGELLAADALQKLRDLQGEK